MKQYPAPSRRIRHRMGSTAQSPSLPSPCTDERGPSTFSTGVGAPEATGVDSHSRGSRDAVPGTVSALPEHNGISGAELSLLPPPLPMNWARRCLVLAPMHRKPQVSVHTVAASVTFIGSAGGSGELCAVEAHYVPVARRRCRALRRESRDGMTRRLRLPVHRRGCRRSTSDRLHRERRRKKEFCAVEPRMCR